MQMTFLTKTRPSGQLLKWVGNKYRYAHLIANLFPDQYGKYIEPFVGTGAVLATMSPHRAVAGDILRPLIDFWKLVQETPSTLIEHYALTIERYSCDRAGTYKSIKERYNSKPNPLDLLILSRTCYGGVMRFTREGLISTPIGPHRPIKTETFKLRLWEWRQRVENTEFDCADFAETMEQAEFNDLVYCDPPYVDTQSILYGAQDFKFRTLIECIDRCKMRGAKVALSIDGNKKSGCKSIDLDLPNGLFEREMFLDCGSSMLRRFQNGGRRMIGEDVKERLLLTW